MNKKDITVEKVIDAYKRMYYKLYTEDYHLNLFGIRDSSNVNSFNDIIGCLYHKDVAWVLDLFDATTDPGLSTLKTPQNSKGTAILVPGQYIDGWKKGLHKGYSAFVQNTEVKVYRDNNKDSKLNMDPTKIDVGFFAINIHRANEKLKSVQVDGWSAGCQVIADPNDFNKLKKLRDLAIANGYPFVTYTLFTKEQFFN